MSETQNVIINNLKMETKRISEKEIEGMPVLATGYKMFKNDWTTKRGQYDYKDEKIFNKIIN